MHDPLACDAPICMSAPKPYNKSCIWFPDEPICNRKPYTHTQKVQKKIQKFYFQEKEADYFAAPVLLSEIEKKFTYYTPEMLKNIKQVRKGIRGISERTKADYAVSKNMGYLTRKSKP